MKKTLLLAAALLAFGIGNAQINAGRIGTGNITIAGMPWEDVYGLDFNNDGTLEFRIADNDGVSGTWTNAYFSYNWTEGGNNIVANSQIWDYIEILAQGDIINANSNFAGYGDATFETLTSVPERIFLGFRILLADGVHYGWAEATVETYETTSDATLNWVACAYNTTPDAAIAAGQTSGNGIVATMLDNFSVKSLGNKTILVEAAHVTATLYSVDGREMNTLQVAGQATLQVPTAGLYLLRVGNVTRKVMVEE